MTKDSLLLEGTYSTSWAIYSISIHNQDLPRGLRVISQSSVPRMWQPDLLAINSNIVNSRCRAEWPIMSESTPIFPAGCAIRDE